jgi:hypothetical protein
MIKLIVFLCSLGFVAHANAQTYAMDDHTEKVLKDIVSFADSVEKLVNGNQLTYDSRYLENPKSGKTEWVVSEYLPGLKFFTPIKEGGNVYGEQIKAQYYLRELPNAACAVSKMTIQQKMVFVKTIARIEGLFKQ